MRFPFRGSPRRKRSLEPIAWGALPVLGLGVGVLASGVGIDLLVLALGCLVLLTFDRTVGDWLAETLGSGPGTVVFGLAAIGFTWYLISYPSDDFFAAAEERGYRTAYYQRAPSPDIPAESGGGTGGDGQSAATPSSGGSVVSDAPAILPTERPADGEARSNDDSATEGARVDTVTQSFDVPPSEVPPSGAPGIASAPRILFGMPGKAPAPTPSRIMLTLSPAQVAPARRTVFQATVTAEGRPLTLGVVDFTVNGTGVGRASLDSRGVARTTFATHIAGLHEVRARFSGTPRYEASSSEIQTLQIGQR